MIDNIVNIYSPYDSSDYSQYINFNLIQLILTGAERRELMGMGVAGIIINDYYGPFPKIPD